MKANIVLPGHGGEGYKLLVRDNLATATSTGGTYAMFPGRVGDSPIIAAGTYEENKIRAVSCTGLG